MNSISKHAHMGELDNQIAFFVYPPAFMDDIKPHKNTKPSRAFAQDGRLLTIFGLRMCLSVAQNST